MSGMNIAEKRLRKMVASIVRIKGRRAGYPRLHGADGLWRKRVAASADSRQDLPEPGQARVLARDEQAIRELIIKPHGIILRDRPTGSGKSTSLYAFLSTINSVQKRIITIEEPVEYELKALIRLPCRSDIGLTFAMGLRHILRQDPNVIMVGEIRDSKRPRSRFARR